ncbi:MAG TPA: hypothetical protein ENF95_02095, partial [Candidatus Aenigmarchaeota archaeon]|nr:hypothetical protein [Candidatus Aenigmarchaeota archaeon]
MSRSMMKTLVVKEEIAPGVYRTKRITSSDEGIKDYLKKHPNVKVVGITPWDPYGKKYPIEKKTSRKRATAKEFLKKMEEYAKEKKAKKVSKTRETVKKVKLKGEKIESIVNPVSKYIVIKRSDAERLGIKDYQTINGYTVIVNEDSWFEKRKKFDAPKIAKEVLERQYEEEMMRLMAQGKVPISEEKWKSLSLSEKMKLIRGYGSNLVIVKSKERFVKEGSEKAQKLVVQKIAVVGREEHAPSAFSGEMFVKTAHGVMKVPVIAQASISKKELEKEAEKQGFMLKEVGGRIEVIPIIQTYEVTTPEG